MKGMANMDRHVNNIRNNYGLPCVVSINNFHRLFKDLVTPVQLDGLRMLLATYEAARLSPRNPEIRQALRLVPPADATSSRWAWIPPVTPEELLLLGALGWLVGWAGWVLRPRVRERWTVLLVFGALAIGAGLGLRAWYRRPIAVVLERSTLRLSPHGLAPVILTLEGASMVRVLRRTPGWLLVRAPGAQDGWLPDEAVAAVGG